MGYVYHDPEVQSLKGRLGMVIRWQPENKKLIRQLRRELEEAKERAAIKRAVRKSPLTQEEIAELVLSGD